jgi:AcrR family transcriptional regulator
MCTSCLNVLQPRTGRAREPRTCPRSSTPRCCGNLRSPRGACAPRAARVAAARRVFERDGYVDARLTDITREAKRSTGNFYTYFAGKEEVFHAVLEAVQDEMLHPGYGPHVDPGSSPYAVIEASNRAYFEAYRRNARLMLPLEQVATFRRAFPGTPTTARSCVRSPERTRDRGPAGPRTRGPRVGRLPGGASAVGDGQPNRVQHVLHGRTRDHDRQPRRHLHETLGERAATDPLNRTRRRRTPR